MISWSEAGGRSFIKLGASDRAEPTAFRLGHARWY